jgi:hypothetical protein
MHKKFEHHSQDCVPPHIKAAELDVFKRSVSRSGMSPESFVQALTQTSLSSLVVWGQVDLELLLLSAERFGVNPLGREIFLIRGDDRPDEPPMVVLGVDGWSHVLNSHKKFAGMQFAESEQLVEGVPAWIECTLHRWDRRVPTTVREYFDEVRGATQPWLTHPRRMLRHKALVQCARLAFGLVGVYDHDEAQRISASKTKTDHRAGTKGPNVKPRNGLGIEAVKRQLGLRVA